MATSQIASMLDELMGRNRNFAPDDASARELKWTDPDVCKYYIVQFCPHDLFTNTKADLGTCGKIHDDALKVRLLYISINNRCAREPNTMVGSENCYSLIYYIDF